MKIGVFDSGFGGLTILQNIRQVLPEYDYVYLGDSARAPYGTRSFEVIYEYTLQAVRYLEAHDCRLIIIACNTASAKALRTIQQRDINPDKLRVLGVIRPTVEAVATLNAQHIGILATPGTVSSGSYLIELQKLDPNLEVSQQACPMWVPLIENNEINSPAMDFYIKKYIDLLFVKDSNIDTIILGCTHYPLIKDKITAYLQATGNGQEITIKDTSPLREPWKGSLIFQGEIVANSLRDYLHRHGEIDTKLSRGGQCEYLTTDITEKFEASASLFLSEPIRATQIELV